MLVLSVFTLCFVWLCVARCFSNVLRVRDLLLLLLLFVVVVVVVVVVSFRITRLFAVGLFVFQMLWLCRCACFLSYFYCLRCCYFYRRLGERVL